MEVLTCVNTALDLKEEGRLLFTDFSYEEGIMAFYRWLTDSQAPDPMERP
jgi:hypothetical protein